MDSGPGRLARRPCGGFRKDSLPVDVGRGFGCVGRALPHYCLYEEGRRNAGVIWLEEAGEETAPMNKHSPTVDEVGEFVDECVGGTGGPDRAR